MVNYLLVSYFGSGAYSYNPDMSEFADPYGYGVGFWEVFFAFLVLMIIFNMFLFNKNN